VVAAAGEAVDAVEAVEVVEAVGAVVVNAATFTGAAAAATLVAALVVFPVADA
jgi:hypothetical protein